MMNGIDFISPAAPPHDRPEFDEISVALAAPRPYIAKNRLSEHLSFAMWFPVADLSGQRHINSKRSKDFQCISYYADDPDVTASCAAQGDLYLAMIGAPFVRRLVKICNQIGLVLHLRPRSLSGALKETRSELVPDETLSQLMAGDAEVSESEAQEIVARWPAADKESMQLELGEYAIFYDLIRLIWLHEWAHALCGHVSFVSSALHIAQLHEFSAERVGEQIIDEVGYPRKDVLQALEMHADEFALRYCVQQILWGYDPIGQIAGPQVDLVDRLLMFNTACCVFAVVWYLAEQLYSPGVSYYPPLQPPTSDQPDLMFVAFKASHPPADLRYLRFRSFQRILALEYDKTHGSRLLTAVDSVSWDFLKVLGKINAHFNLFDLTPMVMSTPRMKRLDAYEAYLQPIGVKIAPRLIELGFAPTVDPLAEPT